MKPDHQRRRAWADLDTSAMAQLIHASRTFGWRQALDNAAETAPSFARRIRDLSLGNWHMLWLPRPGGKALDLGCGYGSLALGLGEFYDQAVGLEPVVERAEFAALRAEQDQRLNTRFVRGGGHRLPFPGGEFDLVTLNGVLEWAALFSSGQPGVEQQALLHEAARVAGDSGIVAVAIENRFALETLTGMQDTHTGLTGIPALPRWAANQWMQWRKGEPYRTWLYSRRGYHRLLRSVDLADTRVLDLVSSYNDYDFILDPCDGASYRLLWARDLVRSFYRPAERIRRVVARWAPRLLGELSYAYLALGGRNVTTLLDRNFSFWRAAARWGLTAGRHRFAVRGAEPNEIAVVTHDGEQITGLVEFGGGVEDSVRRGVLPERLQIDFTSELQPAAEGSYHGIPCRLHLPRMGRLWPDHEKAAIRTDGRSGATTPEEGLEPPTR